MQKRKQQKDQVKTIKEKRADNYHLKEKFFFLVLFFL